MIVIGMAVVLWLATSCSQEHPEELYTAAEGVATDAARHEEAIQQFTLFLERFPQHELAPKALKQLAMIAQQQGEMRQAISYYDRLLKEYPESDQADEAQFMIAFIYEEYLQDLEQARLAYQQVIDQYPDSELADSARRLLPNVGRDPEEWVEFQDTGRGNP